MSATKVFRKVDFAELFVKLTNYRNSYEHLFTNIQTDSIDVILELLMQDFYNADRNRTISEDFPITKETSPMTKYDKK